MVLGAIDFVGKKFSMLFISEILVLVGFQIIC